MSPEGGNQIRNTTGLPRFAWEKVRGSNKFSNEGNFVNKSRRGLLSQWNGVYLFIFVILFLFYFFRLTCLCEDYCKKRTREYRRLTIKERKLQQTLSRETKEVKIDLATPGEKQGTSLLLTWPNMGHYLLGLYTTIAFYEYLRTFILCGNIFSQKLDFSSSHFRFVSTDSF